MANENDEVYVSFDLEDSSLSSFISYLSDAFNRLGIYVSKNGKSSHEASKREWEKERVSKLKVLVVVFSKTFASHLPCLEKQIYSCRNYDDFVVVPVFYRVSKSSVKQHLENFGGAFEAVKQSMHKLRRRHEYDCKRSETEFLDEIARDVFERLYPTEEIGIQSPVEEIENLLCEQPWGVRTIGIFGEPGVGKTTLARAVFRKMSGGYDDSCFIKDFHTEYNEKSLKNLSPEYLRETPMEKFDRNSSDSEPCHRKKRVLVSLDNVRNAEDANRFLGGFDRFGPGSLIIITSGQTQILKDCHMNEIYELKGLNDQDALKLFTRCAFGRDVTEEILLDRSMKVIECCNGNPSTLRSYAKEFKGKDAEEMEPELPEGCEVYITGHNVSRDIVKDTYMHTIPYEENDELQEIEEFQSDHHAVLASTDARTAEFQTYSKKHPGNRLYRRFNQIYFSSGKAGIEYLRRKQNYLQQGLTTQLHKISQSISNTCAQIDQPVLLDLEQPVVLNFFYLPPGVFKKVEPEEREFTRKGNNDIREIVQIDQVN